MGFVLGLEPQHLSSNGSSMLLASCRRHPLWLRLAQLSVTLSVHFDPAHSFRSCSVLDHSKHCDPVKLAHQMCVAGSSHKLTVHFSAWSNFSRSRQTLDCWSNLQGNTLVHLYSNGVQGHIHLDLLRDRFHK